MVRRITRYALLLSIVAGMFALFAVAGCGGGDGVRTGTVKGWLYLRAADNHVVVSESSQLPALHAPIEGAHVEIDGYPLLWDTTDGNGHYVIPCIPPGWRTVVITMDGEELARFRVFVSAGQVTFGGGHVEGGGGL